MNRYVLHFFTYTPTSVTVETAEFKTKTEVYDYVKRNNLTKWSLYKKKPRIEYDEVWVEDNKSDKQ